MSLMPPDSACLCIVVKSPPLGIGVGTGGATGATDPSLFDENYSLFS